MMSHKKRHIGVTLLETMLVLVIGSLLIVLAFRQYQSYRLDADIQQLRSNVNTIMQAMYYYYRANCYGTVNSSTGVVIPGTLNPAATPNPIASSYFPIDIQNDLVNKGFLVTALPTIIPLNPLVDSSGGNTQGYVAQFNLTLSDKLVCTSAVSGQTAFGTYSGVCASTAKIGTAVNWNIQVAVKIQDQTNILLYKQLLQANCLSIPRGSIVPSCENVAGISGTYLIFEQSPAAISTNTSDFKTFNAQVYQSNQLYSTYNTMYSISTGGTVPAAGGGTTTQYFLCNS